jgi:hypothetical protein
MKHDEVVEKWNKFCITSGLRKYCQEVCQGDCCKGTRCAKDCSNSIFCTSFLCNKITNEIWKNNNDLLYLYNNYIRENEKKLKRMRKLFPYRWGQTYLGTKNWPDPSELIEKLHEELDDKITEMNKKWLPCGYFEVLNKWEYHTLGEE